MRSQTIVEYFYEAGLYLGWTVLELSCKLIGRFSVGRFRTVQQSNRLVWNRPANRPVPNVQQNMIVQQSVIGLNGSVHDEPVGWF